MDWGPGQKYIIIRGRCRCRKLTLQGYLSTVDNKAHFGLGNIAVTDSVIIRWPGQKKQVLQKVPANQLLHVDIKNADQNDDGPGIRWHGIPFSPISVHLPV